MSFWKQLKFWVKDSFQSRGDSVKTDSSVSKTLNDSSNVRFGGGHSGGLGPTEEAVKQAMDGHEDYQKSFKKNR